MYIPKLGSTITRVTDAGTFMIPASNYFDYEWLKYASDKQILDRVNHSTSNMLVLPALSY